MKTIRLYGKLGKQFGRVHNMAVETVSEAVRALCSQLPGFEQELMTSKDRGITYACFAGKKNLNREELQQKVAHDDDIRIAPIMAGAKKQGVLQTFIGVVLIIVGYIAYAYGYGPLGTALQRLGWGLVAGGIAQMLTPTPKGRAAQDRPENKPSYNFNGPINTQAQGNPVPVLYGELIVGSAVVSAGIDVTDQAFIPATSPGSGYGGGGGGGAATWHNYANV